MTEIPEDEPAGPSEFSLLSENAEPAGVAGPLPEGARVATETPRGRVSALRWGSKSPRVVFLHGGAQNAHTWDTVIVGLGQPALAVTFPGTGTPAGVTTGTTRRDTTPRRWRRCCASSHRTPISLWACRWAG